MEEIYEIMDELKIYSELEETEVGEMCELLIRLYSFGDYYSEAFAQALENEIREQLINFRNNSEIIVKNVSIKHIIKELVWK